MIAKEDHRERMALYQRGLSDTEISRRLYVTPATILYWRKCNGLPPNRPRNGLTEQELETMERMYWAGASDGKIARETGRCLSTVQSWRRRNGLPGNYGKRGRPIHERRT